MDGDRLVAALDVLPADAPLGRAYATLSILEREERIRREQRPILDHCRRVGARFNRRESRNA